MTVAYGLWLLAAAAPAAAWVWLLAARDGFWRADQRLPDGGPEPAAWPQVVAIVPARDEAAVIGRAVASLAAQDYPARLSVIVVDDGSTDGTGRLAREAAPGVEVLEAGALPPGWKGKIWALQRGLDHAGEHHRPAAFVWLTDADIEHDRGELRRLVAKAEAERLDLVSLMVRLHCAGLWERLLIPAFVFFFQKLYPFPAVNDPARRTAAAAGGSMLVRRAALARAGGLAPIRDAIIDDCALAREIKKSGAVWLGLARRTRSIRAYAGLGGIWTMVARGAFDQLGYSPMRLAITVAGMLALYVAPPLLALGWWVHGDGWTSAAGLAAWILMAVAYAPTLRLYGEPRVLGLALPAAALIYTLMTVDSARRHAQGRGVAWKARTYAASR